MRYTAYIGLGSNLPSAAGTPADTVQAAIHDLSALGRVTARSSLYRTAPVGYREQPHFINAVVFMETMLEPERLLLELLAIERSFGRERGATAPKGPRTLDLDLLLVFDRKDNGQMEGEAITYESPTLTLPHPEIANRHFVLQPLAELAPDLRHPVLLKTMRQLLSEPSVAGGNMEQEITRL